MIESIAPTWAVKRAEARARLDLVGQTMQASARGALQTRTSTPWSTSVSYRGGTTAQRQNYSAMRDRGRRAFQENPIARSLLTTETDYVVGDGFTFQSRTGQKDFDRESEKLFPEWLDEADYRRMATRSDLFRMSWLEPRKDGSGGFLLIGGGAESQLQYIPGDKIGGRTSFSVQKLKNGNMLQSGVETDAVGRPVFFHIEVEDEWGMRKLERVPASDFIYLAHLQEPLGISGCTCYATIFELLDQISGYVDAVVIAARMAAIFGLIFKSDSSAKELSGLSAITNSNRDQQKAAYLENGELRYVGSRDDVVQVQAHQPMNQTPDFIRAIFRLICLPFGLPIELGMKDVSQVTFISGRLGLRDAERNYKSKQNWLRSRGWYRIYEWWIARERKKQRIGLPTRFTAMIPDEAYLYEFIPPPFPVADPLSEAQTELLEIAIGKRTPQQVCLAGGNEFDENQLQIEAARKSNEAKGIPNVLSTLTRDGKALPDIEPNPTVAQKVAEKATKDGSSEDSTNENKKNNEE